MQVLLIKQNDKVDLIKNESILMTITQEGIRLDVGFDFNDGGYTAVPYQPNVTDNIFL